MPVMEPHPQNGQKKLLQLFGAILGVVIAVSIVAIIAQRMG